MTNNWDILAERFNTHKKKEKIHSDAAVNIRLGWDFFIEQIKYQSRYIGSSTLDILDFGCGAGKFSQILFESGHRVKAIDKSDSMVRIARKNLPHEIGVFQYSNLTEGFGSIDSSQFDAIVSIHVFDWISEIDILAEKLAGMLKRNGIIIFSVFPKIHIVDSLRIGDLFEDFDSVDDPTFGIANFDGVKIPVYVRDVSFFDNLFDKMKFEKVCEFYPPFPKSFLDKYKWNGSLKPEMVILAYRKL